MGRFTKKFVSTKCISENINVCFIVKLPDYAGGIAETEDRKVLLYGVHQTGHLETKSVRV